MGAALTIITMLAVGALQNVRVGHDMYDVVWDSASKDSSGSMPLGNGDIGLNVWVEPNGDLVLLVSKTDAWDGYHRLLKLGRVRVKLTPNPFQPPNGFQQRLVLSRGEIMITAGTEPEPSVRIAVWVDANRPVIHVSMAGKESFDASATVEIWRDTEQELPKIERDGVDGFSKDDVPRLEPDTVVEGKPDAVAWYHRNEKSIWASALKHQGLENVIPKLSDPLMHRTFGALMTAEGFQKADRLRIQTSRPGKAFDVAIFAVTAQTATAEEWVALLDKTVADAGAVKTETAKQEHDAWWKAFWERSYIHVGDVPQGQKDEGGGTFTVAQGYALQRFINACAGRGGSPIKFNGSIFTVDKPGSYGPDYRQWGGMYWFQNTRLPYWSMLYAGDYEMMRPLFKMYKDALPLALERTKIYYGHEGAFFPETMTFWGTYSDGEMGYGWDREGQEFGLTVNPYIRRYWSGGIELIMLMLDYYEQTGDEPFVKSTVLPLADAVLTFFDRHWKRGDDGKIRFEPAQSLETWHTAVDPLPEIAGLRVVLGRMLELKSDAINEEQRNAWKRTLNDLPVVPSKNEGGGTFLLPAASFGNRSNSENPELYAVFPYRMYGLGKPAIEVARETWERRIVKRTGGWTQDPIQAALLGLTDTAAEYMAQNFATHNPDSRFPAFWGPNFDWVPDQDHGCVAMTALQRMLMQCEGKKILLFPAWPKDWDVHFKLHAPGQTTVEAVYRKGKAVKVTVAPESRAGDIEIDERIPH